MSTPTPSPAKAGGAWTEAEKYQFLLKIIGQLGGKGGHLKGVNPKFDEIDLNGRTAKAMSLMWNKIKNEIPVDASSGTKAPASTPRKRKANGDTPKTPASKRKAPTKGGKGKGKKRYDESDDEEMEMPELGSDSDDDIPLTKLYESSEHDEDDFVKVKDEV